MQHLDEGTIHAWLDGALDAEESARVEQHVRACAECAAMVAEARGLVAGASRILSALDHVPRVAGVGGAAGGGAGGSSYRSRSLWGKLHLTPLRAAAAALVFLAAGTVLVAREGRDAPMTAARVVMVRDTVAGVVPNAPPPRPSADVSAQVAASAAEPKPVAAASPVSARHENAAVRAQVATSAAVAEKLSVRTPTVADSLSVSAPTRDVAVDSTSIRESPVANAAKRAAAPAAVVGGVAQPAPALAPPRGYANIARPAELSYVGCYAVIADSAAALPQKLALDSARAVSLGDAVAGVSGRAQRPAAAKAAELSHAVSALFGNARQPLSNASWQPLPSGGVRLSIHSPMRTLLLQPTPSADLRGSTMVSGRVFPVTLRKEDCR